MKEYQINHQLVEIFLKNGFLEVGQFSSHRKLIYPRYPTNFVIVNNGSLDSKGLPALYQAIPENAFQTLICYLCLSPQSQGALKKYAGKKLEDLVLLMENLTKPVSKQNELPFSKKMLESLKTTYNSVSLY